MLRDGAVWDNQFRYDPAKDIIFFYSPEHKEAQHYLQEIFPAGRTREVITYKGNDNYMVYRVPALGIDGFQEFLRQHGS
jgi:hypothetical protein